MAIICQTAKAFLMRYQFLLTRQWKLPIRGGRSSSLARLGLETNSCMCSAYRWSYWKLGTLTDESSKNASFVSLKSRVPVRRCIGLFFGYVLKFLMLIWKMAFVFHKIRQAITRATFKEIVNKDKYVWRLAFGLKSDVVIFQ